MKAISNVGRFLEEAKVAELIEYYSALGYTPTKKKLGFDLVVEKGRHRIAFEIKAAGGAALSKAAISRLHARAAKLGIDFNLVLVRPPHRTIIEVEGLEELLLEILRNDTPNDLRELSSNTMVDEVADIELDQVKITAASIELRGTGYVGVTLEYSGGDAKDGLTAGDGYPFTFDISLEHDLTLLDTKEIQVDTSSFYK